MASNQNLVSAIFLRIAQILTEGVREDAVLKKFPDWAPQIKFFVENDPSGNRKYLEWSCKMLDGEISTEEEIQEVVNLFHKYSTNLDKKDINQYKISDFEPLRDRLFEIDLERNKTKEKYKMPSDCMAEVIYDSKNFLVRHIQNKSASVHYGLGTKWCIAMKDETHFHSYDQNNSVFFFIFNKRLTIEDPNYKIACEIQRDKDNRRTDVCYYDAEDTEFDSVSDKLGKENMLIMSEMFKVAKSVPRSLLARLDNEELSRKELLACYEEYKDKQASDDKSYVLKKIAETSNCPEIILRGIMSLDEENSKVERWTAIKNPNFPIDLMQDCAKSAVYREALVRNPNCPTNFLEFIMKKCTSYIKTIILAHKNCSDDMFLRLTKDKSVEVRILCMNHKRCSLDMFRKIAEADQSNYFQSQVAESKKCPPDVLLNIVKNESIRDSVKAHVVSNQKCPVEAFEYVWNNITHQKTIEAMIQNFKCPLHIIKDYTSENGHVSVLAKRVLKSRARAGN